MLRHTHPLRSESKISQRNHLEKNNRIKFWNENNEINNPKFFFQTIEKILIKIDKINVNDAKLILTKLKLLLTNRIYNKTSKFFLKKYINFIKDLIYKITYSKYFFSKKYKIKYDFYIRKKDILEIEKFNKKMQ